MAHAHAKANRSIGSADSKSAVNRRRVPLCAGIAPFLPFLYVAIPVASPGQDEERREQARGGETGTHRESIAVSRGYGGCVRPPPPSGSRSARRGGHGK